MSEYKAEEYFPVYLKCVRANQVLPFSCYVLLKQNDRIVLWVKSNQILTHEKYQKLKEHSIDKVYVRVEEKKSYFKYLDAYLSSEAGKTSLKEIQENQNSQIIEGLPDPSEFKLQSLDSRDSLVEDSSNVTNSVSNIENREFEVSQKTIPETGKVDFEPELSGPFGEVIETIKSEVTEFQRIAIGGVVRELESRKVIEDCTLVLNDELIRIESKLNQDGDIEPTLIKGFKDQFKKQIMIVRDSVAEDESTVLSKVINTISNQIEEDDSLSGTKKMNPRNLRKQIKFLKSHLARLNRLAKEDPHTIVSQAVSQMINSVEKKIGQRLTLDSEVGMYEDIPDYISQKLDLDDVLASKSNDIKKFQHQIIKQNLLIKELDKKHKRNCEELKSLRDKWYLFQVQAKKNLSGGDILLAKEIDKCFQDFENQTLGLGSESNILVSVASQLTLDMGGKHISIDPQLLAEIGALSVEEQQKLRLKINAQVLDVKSDLPSPVNTFQVEEYLDKKEGNISIESEETREGIDAEVENYDLGMDSVSHEVTLGDVMDLAAQDEAASLVEQAKQLEQLKSEIELLKTQLENSQKLVEAGGIKIDELTQLLERNNDLTEKLEDQNLEYQKLNASLEEKVERYQSSEDNYHDTLGAANSETKITKAQVDSQNEIIAGLSEQLDIYRRQNAALKDKLGTNEVFKEIEEQMDKMRNSLTLKQEEVQLLKKETIQLSAKLNESQQKYKHISHKISRLMGEQEALRKANRASQLKALSATNSLKQMRKTVSKLTSLSDQLRKDRHLYIRKTNEAMAKFEVMVSEAANLNRKVLHLTAELEVLKKSA